MLIFLLKCFPVYQKVRELLLKTCFNHKDHKITGILQHYKKKLPYSANKKLRGRVMQVDFFQQRHINLRKNVIMQCKIKFISGMLLEHCGERYHIKHIDLR